MDFLGKILNRFGFYRKPKEIPKQSKGTEILPWSEIPDDVDIVFPSRPDRIKKENYLTEVKSWVQACVNAIADEVATIEFHLYRKKGKELEEVNDHPLLDLLYRVNDFTTKFDHVWLTQAYLELTGEAPWLLDREGGKLPVSIYLLRPDKLSIVFDKENVIGGWTYEPSPGNKLTFGKDDVILIRYPSFVKPFRGRGTLEGVRETIELDKYAEEWNVNFFFNAARPDAILSTDQKLTEEQIKRIAVQWDKKFKGIGKRGKLAILEAGLKYQPMQLSQKDMDFIEQQRFSRDKILSIFRVPKPVVAITEDVNRANSEAAQYAFARWTIRPKMKRIVEQLNEFLVPMFGDDLYLDFEDPVPENVELKVKKYKEALGPSGWMTINEVRKREGLPPIENGDSVMRPMSVIGQGETTKMISFPVKKKEKDYPQKFVYPRKEFKKRGLEDVNKAIKEVIKQHLKIKKNRVKKNEIIKDVKRFWYKQIEIQEKHENIFITKLRDLFDSQEKEVISKLKKKSIEILAELRQKQLPDIYKDYWHKMKSSIPALLLDVRKENKKFVVKLTPTLGNTINDIGEYTLDEMNIEQEFENNKRVEEYLDKYPIKFSDSVNKRTNRMIRKTLKEGMAEGESIYKLTKRVEEVFKIAKTSRAQMIARTETSRAANFATVEAYKQSGVVKAKKWLTAFDERTCGACKAMDGKIVSLNKNFFNKGDSYMGIEFDYDAVSHPPLHCSCRCTVIPVI